MQADITPTRTGLRLAARAADACLALRSAAARRLLAWVEAHERRLTERALRQLSPWLRRDLGLDRGEAVSVVAAGPVDGPTRVRMTQLARRHSALL